MANVSREQKVVVRARIVEAAKRLFAEQGYQGTTTREIADAARVSESSIFTYFGTKDDLLVAIVIPEPPTIDRIVSMTTPWQTVATLMRYHFAPIFTLDRRLQREYVSVLQRAPVTSKSNLLEITHAFDRRLIDAVVRTVEYFAIEEPEMALQMIVGVITSGYIAFTLDPKCTAEEYLARLEAQLEYLLSSRVAATAALGPNHRAHMQIAI